MEVKYYATPTTPAGLAAAMRKIREAAIAVLRKAKGFEPARDTLTLVSQVESAATHIALEFEAFKPQSQWSKAESEACAAIFASSQVLSELQGRTAATRSLGQLEEPALARIMKAQARAFDAAGVLELSPADMFPKEAAFFKLNEESRDRALEKRRAKAEIWQKPLWTFALTYLRRRNATNAEVIAAFKRSTSFIDTRLIRVDATNEEIISAFTLAPGLAAAGLHAVDPTDQMAVTALKTNPKFADTWTRFPASDGPSRFLTRQRTLHGLEPSPASAAPPRRAR